MSVERILMLVAAAVLAAVGGIIVACARGTPYEAHLLRGGVVLEIGAGFLVGLTYAAPEEE